VLAELGSFRTKSRTPVRDLPPVLDLRMVAGAVEQHELRAELLDDPGRFGDRVGPVHIAGTHDGQGGRPDLAEA
jgi:hypothetical protein